MAGGCTSWSPAPTARPRLFPHNSASVRCQARHRPPAAAGGPRDSRRPTGPNSRHCRHTQVSIGRSRRRYPGCTTFATGHPDSVPWSSTNAGAWWHELSTWDGPLPGASRSLAALARTDPGATLLLVLSPPYLRACRQDILDAAAALDNADRLMVVSVGADRTGPLADLLVAADGRLQGLFGGSKLSINVRVAAHIISAGLHTRSYASAMLTELAGTQPAPVTLARQRLSDAEVTAYIHRSLSADPAASATRLLRTLRDAELACEQQRFYQLYRDLVGGSHGYEK